ncbi:MAG: hypothetical protein WC554_11740 [Clostridia bacterium]
MTDPNATPESLELLELRALRADVARVAANVDLIREAVLGLGGRVADLERDRDRVRLGPATPPPLRAVHDSWSPDHGDQGKQR